MINNRQLNNALNYAAGRAAHVFAMYHPPSDDKDWGGCAWRIARCSLAWWRRKFIAEANHVEASQ